MNKKKRQIWLIWEMLTPFILIVVLFLLLPAILMIWDSFRSDGSFSIINYSTAITNKYYLKAISNSIKISIISSIIGLSISSLCAYSLSNLKEKSQNHIITILNMTSNFSGVPLSLGYILLLGNTGMFVLFSKHFGFDIFNDFNLYSWIGLIVVYIYFQIPIGIMFLYPAFIGIRKEWREAAMILGANSFYFWIKIGVPILLPSIVGTLSMLFANAMGAYSTAYALVGNNYNLLSIRIGSLIVGDIVPKPELASALAIILAMTSISMMFINEKMSKYLKKGLK